MKTTSGGGASAKPRVLVVHDWARADVVSGTDRVVESDIMLLRSAGVEVETYSRSDEEIAGFGRLRWTGLAIRPIVSPSDVKAFGRVLRRFRPDVVHVHNTLPLISPWIIRTAASAGVPVVQAVHDFIHVCIARTYFRDGHPCHDCRGRALPWPGVLHACAPGPKLSKGLGARLRSAVFGASLVVHRPTWRHVDRFLPVGRVLAWHLEMMGIEPRRISIRPGSVEDPGPPSPPTSTDALFVGRLSAEKGVELLISAWRKSGLGERHRLRLAGDGPDRAKIERAARGIPGLEFLGAVPHSSVLALMSQAGFVVVPSAGEENFTRVIIEAMAQGRPVLATNLGEPQYMVHPDSGWLTEPEEEALARSLRVAAEAPHATMGEAARLRYLERFSPEASLQTLLDIYDDVITKHR